MKNSLILLLIIILTALPVISKEVGGKNLPDNTKIDNTSLVLNGAGVIKKFFFKIYAIGLYLTEKSSDENYIMNADKPMSIKMHFIRDGIDINKIQESFDEGFKKSTGGKLPANQKEFVAFKACFTNTVKEDDVFQYDYIPGTGTRIYINKQLKATIPGLTFKKYLFGVWIGSDPRDDGVKDKLLGK